MVWHNPVFNSLYELVRHDIKAGFLSQFEHVALEGMPARLLYDYPKPMGMWHSEFGPSQRGSRSMQSMYSYALLEEGRGWGVGRGEGEGEEVQVEGTTCNAYPDPAKKLI